MNTPRLLGTGTSVILHAGMLAAIVWSQLASAPSSVKSPAPSPIPLEVPDARSGEVPTDGISFPDPHARAEVHIGEFHFDYRKIAERPAQLFPFLTRALPLERATMTARYVHGTALLNAPAPATVRPAARRLILSDKALQQLVDGAWSRRERWAPFRRIAALVTAHGPDDDRVLALLRAYRDQNVLQPYFDTSRDAALWVMLGIAADHGDFVNFVSEYAARYPSSRITTELLFLLDELAQGSLDALSVLLDTRGHELWWTRDANRDAYDLLIAVQRHYRTELGKLGVRREDLGAYYGSVRLRLLSHIVRTAPEGSRINDARFLMGDIYWNQGRIAEAVNQWREMTPDPEGVYARVSSDLAGLLHAGALDAAAVDRILEAEKSRWMVASARRLAQFGYQVDGF